MSGSEYWMNDCRIDVPEGFRDLSTHVLEWRTEEGDRIALAVTREPALNLEAYVTIQTRDYPTRFAGYHVERNETADAPFAMRRLAFRWRNDHDVLYHQQVFVLLGAQVVVLTAAAKAAHREAVDLLVHNAVGGFARRD